jgi:predicted nucleotidyltransferase component of viral defense system
MKKPVKGIDDNRILTFNQKTFLNEFIKSELKDVFRLSGGTALSAFYLEHRFSEDLDFLSKENVPLTVLESFLKSISIVEDIFFTKLFDRNIFNLKIKDKSFLKVEFTATSLINLEDNVLIDHLIVDSFLDIIVNKLCAIADRYEAKDYVDVYCALKDCDLSLKELMSLAEKKCGIKGIRYVLESRLLQIPDGIDKLQLRISLTEDDIRTFFEKYIIDIISDKKL